MTNPVSVVIAAKDAASTIERAVLSVARQPETLEIIVVDDGSSDDTGARARAAGGDKVVVERLDQNRGPSAARNIGFGRAKGEFLCILDADDFMKPGRLAGLVAQSADYDFVADDLWLSLETSPDTLHGSLIGGDLPLPLTLDLLGFARGNLVTTGQKRHELGFLKPLIRRDFVRAHALIYDEALRLGEDYIFYAQALIAGARFRLIEGCGYVAVERANSLSGQHKTADLVALAGAASALCAQVAPGEARSALNAYATHTRNKAVHRQILDIKREQGAAKAAIFGLQQWRSAGYVLTQTLRDKTR